MTRRGADTLTWDGRGRMSGGTFQGSPLATSVSYSFDPLERRRERTGGGVTTRYLFAGIDEAPLFETNGLGVIVNTELDGPGGDLAHYAGPPTAATPATFLYYNGHGDVAAAANAVGMRTNAYSYDPFGAPREGQPANTTVERWTGRWDKQLDTATSLIQMGVRPYDPALGRFLAVDPIDGGSFNTYDYAFQDPLNTYDLSGACPWCAAVRAVAGRAARAAQSAAHGARRAARYAVDKVGSGARQAWRWTSSWRIKVELHGPITRSTAEEGHISRSRSGDEVHEGVTG